jgi:hypothetical protein
VGKKNFAEHWSEAQPSTVVEQQERETLSDPPTPAAVFSWSGKKESLGSTE